MKLHQFIFPVLFPLSATSLLAATYSTDFSTGYVNVGDSNGDKYADNGIGTPPVITQIAHGQPTAGWTINSGENSELSFFTVISGEVRGALGGPVAFPDTTHNIDLKHDAILPISGGIKFNTTLGIQGSTSTDAVRDSFGWTLTGNTGELIRIALVPTATANVRQLQYSVGGAALSAVPGSYLVVTNGPIYDLTINLSNVGGNALIAASMTGAFQGFPLGTTATFGNTIAGIGATGSLQTVGADYDVTATLLSNAGDNFMFFDNLSVIVPIPETSTTFLALTAGLIGLSGRRRK